MYSSGSVAGSNDGSSLDTITITLDNMSSDYGIIAQDISTLDLSTISITNGYSSINDTTWNWIDTVPFENGFPEWNDFQKMCKEYPGLEKTFEHLKVFYKLCHDEWKAKKKGEE
jgi:hypothetical protein